MWKLDSTSKGDDVRLLHALLNWHLPPPSDQLPIEGDGAVNYGPRTIRKVKEFQRLNRIDYGKQDYMDGIVGPDTLAVLQSHAQFDFRATIDDPNPQPDPNPWPNPSPMPKPLPSPALIPPPAPQQPPVIPVPKLHLDDVQIQAGRSLTLNSTRQPNETIFFQASHVLLWRNQGPHTEISFGFTNMFSVPPKEGSDFQMFGQITRADIPIFGVPGLTASVFAQAAAQSLLPLKPFRPVVGIGAGLQVQWEIKGTNLSIGAQGMPFLNIVSDPDDKLRVLTGGQIQGFMTLKLLVGKREN